MPLPLPHPTASGEEICDKAGVPYSLTTPGVSLQGSKRGRKLPASQAAAMDAAVPARAPAHRGTQRGEEPQWSDTSEEGPWANPKMQR